jgi:hypothetical protein
MTQDKLLHIFLEGAGIETDTDDNILLGQLLPQDAPAGVDAIMKTYTAHIDGILQQLPKNSLQRVELVIRRGFTFSEYQALFDVAIREKHFSSHVIFRALWIITEQERRRIAFTLSKDSYDDYLAVLTKTLSPFPSLLVNFFFGGSRYRKGFSTKAFTPTCFTMWKKWSRKKQTYGGYVF